MFRKLPELPGGALTIYIDGQPIEADPAESVAAVLLRQEEPWSRLTPVTRSRRAPYCMMGVCFECIADMEEGQSVQTCLIPVREGLRIVRRRGKRSLSE
jgi:D-hydroxyproline dehydrogenase subunit gamma